GRGVGAVVSEEPQVAVELDLLQPHGPAHEVAARVDGGEHGDPGVRDELGDLPGALVGHRVLLAVIGWAGRGGRDVTEPRAGGAREPGAGAPATRVALAVARSCSGGVPPGSYRDPRATPTEGGPMERERLEPSPRPVRRPTPERVD